MNLEQPWRVFSPNPLREDGWYVVVATLSDGRKVDLFRGGRPVDWNKPQLVSADYPTEPWRKYMLTIWVEKYRDHVRHFARYLRKTWDSAHTHSERVVKLDVYFMLEFTLPPGNGSAPVSKKVVYQWTETGTDEVTPVG